LGAVQLDTLIVFSNICTFLTMAPSGIAISTSTLVGHAIGAGHASQARMYAHASCCLILLFALFEFLCLELLRHELVRVFTTDPAVNEAFKHISMCVALFVLFDCYQNVEGGVLRGLGYQSFGAKVNGAVFYLLGLPLGFLLTFQFDFGVAGLVIGLVTSVAAQTVVFFLKLQRIDWSHEVLLSQQRIADERTHSPLLSLRSNSITSAGEEDDDDPDVDEEEQKSTPR
jgi:MATE family multidrug resistance protein